MCPQAAFYSCPEAIDARHGERHHGLLPPSRVELRSCGDLPFSGGQSLRGSHVKADPRKVQVHFADRGVFVPDDDFIGRPCEYGAMQGFFVLKLPVTVH